MVDTDPAVLVERLRAELTGRGGDFELGIEDVRGISLPVFIRRRRSLTHWLHESIAWGDREYLVQGDRRVTYEQHAADVAALADLLERDYRVGPGDRVAIFAANSPDWVLAFWAAISL